MLGKLLNVFGDSNDREVKRYQRVVETVGGLEKDVAALDDDALAARTAAFCERIARGESLDDLLPEAFAVVREAAQRAIGMRHFDVQIVGGAALHQGKVAEMKTGEGKTLVATLPVYLNALEGRGVHVVTVNDYLARRDALWMGKVYSFLGLSTGCLQHESAFILDPGYRPGGAAELRPVPRKEAYEADVTYGTNNEFGFDYLRDNMAGALAQKVQHGLNYAIVDEVDNILIDEARTPLIISGPSQSPPEHYERLAKAESVVRFLTGKLEDENENEDADYTVYPKERQVTLTPDGIHKTERALGIDNLYSAENEEWPYYIDNALRGKALYTRDKDYVVTGDKQVVIVDEFTGRLMPGRRYGEGLHQAIEQKEWKERVRVQPETSTYATVTLQNLFRSYDKLAGMTGTAITEAEEFYEVYGLDVVAVPPNKDMVRIDHPDFVYKTHDSKFRAVVDDIAELNAEGRPVLVGTTSIERSEQLSGLLRRRGIKHEVLNAKNHEREAQIVAEAGKPGAVTVSTNMAGRGTDIILGGDPSSQAEPGAWQRAHEEVVARGGLCVIGTERHESRRIDNQLRGRAGRQGDPGETRFYGSLEDDILKRFSSGMVGRLVGTAFAEDAPLESGMLTKSLEMTQSKAESYFFDVRKHLVKYDDVVNNQRKEIYGWRDEVLADEENIKAEIQDMIKRELSTTLHACLPVKQEEWDIQSLFEGVGAVMPLTDAWAALKEQMAEDQSDGDNSGSPAVAAVRESLYDSSTGQLQSLPEHLDEQTIVATGITQTENLLLAAAEALYRHREEEYGAEIMRQIERNILLGTIDQYWVNHLTTISNLRQSIGLEAYGQRDPLVMYRTRAAQGYKVLREDIERRVAHSILRVVPMVRTGSGSANGNGKAIRVDTTRTETVMAKAIGQRRTTAPAAPVDLPADASRSERRRAERAAGGGKKARKRKGR